MFHHVSSFQDCTWGLRLIGFETPENMHPEHMWKLTCSLGSTLRELRKRCHSWICEGSEWRRPGESRSVAPRTSLSAQGSEPRHSPPFLMLPWPARLVQKARLCLSKHFWHNAWVFMLKWSCSKVSCNSNKAQRKSATFNTSQSCKYCPSAPSGRKSRTRMMPLRLDVWSWPRLWQQHLLFHTREKRRWSLSLNVQKVWHRNVDASSKNSKQTDIHTYKLTHIHTYTHNHKHTTTYRHTDIHRYTHIHTYIHYITLHYIALHCITLHYITIHYITFHYIKIH